MTPDDLKRIEHEVRELRQSYKAMQGPGMDDFLAWLSSQEQADRRTAETEVDNPARRAVYLQSSIAYSIVKSHLAKMLGDDLTT